MYMYMYVPLNKCNYNVITCVHGTSIYIDEYKRSCV